MITESTKQESKIYSFYGSFGSGQPGYPGYLLANVHASETVTDNYTAEFEARRRFHEATGGRWCGTYDSLGKVHPSDRIFRGLA